MTQTLFEDQIGSVSRRLAAELNVSPEVVEPEARAAFAQWGHARVRDFVPIFVERQLRDTLRQRASTVPAV